MNAELMELAMEDGCDTAKELAIWYAGYCSGKVDGINALAGEIRLPEIDVDEDEEYDKASSNAGELI